MFYKNRNMTCVSYNLLCNLWWCYLDIHELIDCFSICDDAFPDKILCDGMLIITEKECIEKCS